MRSELTLSALAILGLLAAPGRAVAVAPTPDFTAGSDCFQLGETHWAKDNSGLLACGLKSPFVPDPNGPAVTCANGGGCEWKSMAEKVGGWINVPPGTYFFTQLGATVGYMADPNMSPSAWCVINGFKAASGSCRDVGIEGVLLSNQSYNAINNPYSIYTWACLGALPAGFILSPSTQIRCD